MLNLLEAGCFFVFEFSIRKKETTKTIFTAQSKYQKLIQNSAASKIEPFLTKENIFQSFKKKTICKVVDFLDPPVSTLDTRSTFNKRNIE